MIYVVLTLVQSSRSWENVVGWRKAVRLTAIQTEMNSSGSPDVIHPYGQNITKEILNLSPPTRQYSTAIPQAGLDPLMRQFWTPGRMFGNNFMVDPFLWIHQKGTLTIKSLCTLMSKNLIIITLIALFQDFSSSIRFSMGLRPPITPTTHYQDVHQLWPPPSRIWPLPPRPSVLIVLILLSFFCLNISDVTLHFETLFSSDYPLSQEHIYYKNNISINSRVIKLKLEF